MKSTTEVISNFMAHQIQYITGIKSTQTTRLATTRTKIQNSYPFIPIFFFRIVFYFVISIHQRQHIGLAHVTALASLRHYLDWTISQCSNILGPDPRRRPRGIKWLSMFWRRNVYCCPDIASCLSRKYGRSRLPKYCFFTPPPPPSPSVVCVLFSPPCCG